MRRRLYQILNNPAAGDRVGRTISIALLVLIAANVLANVIETDDEIAASAPHFFRIFELASVCIFAVEYLVRLWTAAEDPRFAGKRLPWLRMVFTPMALIDLAAIAPSLVTLLAPTVLDLRYLRVLRLLRVFRLLRMRGVSESFATLVRVLQSKRVEITVAIIFVVAAMFVSAGAMYMVERHEAGTQFTSIPRAMWWAIVTITTIGYGDMVPHTPLGQSIAGIVGFIGICAIALPVGILSSGFIDEINNKKAEQRKRECPHCHAALD